MQRMRILLQHRDTGLYFEDINSWCADASEAMVFVSSTQALEFRALNKLDSVQVVLKFEGEKERNRLAGRGRAVLPKRAPDSAA